MRRFVLQVQPTGARAVAGRSISRTRWLVRLPPSSMEGGRKRSVYNETVNKCDTKTCHNAYAAIFHISGRINWLSKYPKMIEISPITVHYLKVSHFEICPLTSLQCSARFARASTISLSM